jgi:hypothetical protein
MISLVYPIITHSCGGSVNPFNTFINPKREVTDTRLLL